MSCQIYGVPLDTEPAHFSAPHNIFHSKPKSNWTMAGHAKQTVIWGQKCTGMLGITLNEYTLIVHLINFVLCW